MPNSKKKQKPKNAQKKLKKKIQLNPKHPTGNAILERDKAMQKVLREMGK